MKSLFLTNYYPPASWGGYEQWCQEIAEGMRNRGHDVVVLTSDYQRGNLQDFDPSWVHRELHVEMELVSLINGIKFFTIRKRNESKNLDQLRHLLNRFSPDTILVWGMWNLPRSLPALTEKMKPGRVAYYIADYWPILPGQFENYWQTPARNWTTKIPKNILRPFANRILATEKQPILDFAHTIFPTRFLRDKLKNHTMLIGNSTIIYGAVDTRLYNHSINNLRSKQNSFVSLLYAGRLTRDKGVHTAIQAIDILIHQMNTNHLKLTIIGSGEADYEDHLRRLVSQSGLDQFVKFLGAQPKEIMPDLYNDADILLFTSIWPEPFGRVIVEAMASGVVVVGAKSGGAAEIMDHNINALVYEPGDAETLANHLHQLIESPQLRYRLAINGQKMASERFNIQRMTSEIEAYLMSII